VTRGRGTLEDRLVVRSIGVDELPAAGWDELLAEGQFYVSSTWLRVAEATNRLPTRYLVVADAESGAAVAGTTCSLVDLRTPIIFARIDKVLGRLLEKRAPSADPDGSLGKRLLPSLVCGGRQVGHSYVLRAPVGEASVQLARRIVESAEEVAKELGARSVCFHFVDGRDVSLRGVLRDTGFVEFFHTHRCYLPVAWPDFEGYTFSLTQRRRSSVRRERRALAEAGVELELVPLTESLADELAPQALSVSRKYGGDPELADVRRALATHAHVLAHGALVAVARRGGEWLGFTEFFRWRDELYAGRAGFDYERKGKLPVYFAVVFYEAIEYAARSRVAQIDYGIEFFGTKIARGCRTTPLYGYAKALAPGTSDELREVLKGLADELPPEQLD
jgi:hypothetical protein